MADQLDFRPVVGRQLRGFVGGRPRLGDEQSQPVDVIWLNGEMVGTVDHRLRSPISLLRPLSPAEQYAIREALKKHKRTTTERSVILPFNYGHAKRTNQQDVRPAIREAYRKRRRTVSLSKLDGARV